jgi:copper chaperone CopZ
MNERTRTRIALGIDGLTGSHAVRAVWTALGAVPGIVSADVALSGVQLEMEGVLDEAVLGAALEAAGVTLRSVTIVQPRVLPIL